MQGCIVQGNGYFRADLCWIATTLNCVLIKLISQLLGYCHGSFGCTSDLLHSINVYTSTKWHVSGMFVLEKIKLYLVRSSTVKFQVDTMKSWTQNHYSIGSSMAKISGLLCLSLFNK